MDTEEQISAFVWIQVAVAMLIQVFLVVFVVGFIVGHYFIKEDSKTVEVAPNGEEISFGTPAPMASWSLPNGDQYNHRVAESEVDSENVKELGEAWTLPVGVKLGPEANSFAATPVADEKGVVYLQDGEGNVTAVNVETGQEIWKREFNVPAAGPNGVTFSHEAVYGCATSSCFALDPKTGEEIWKTKKLVSGEDEAIVSAPQVKNGIVFVSASAAQGGGEAIALDASSGEVLWQASGNDESQEGAVAGAAAIGPDGTVFIGIGGAATALDPGSGEALWSQQDEAVASPVYSEESGQPLVLVAGTTGSVEALDPKSGEQIWQASLGEGGVVATNMALDEGVAYVVAVSGEAGQSIEESGGAITAIEVKSGKVLWEEELGAAPFGAATVSNDMVFTTLFDGTVVGVSRSSGQVLWEEDLPGASLSPLVIEGDTLIAVNSVPGGSDEPQIVAYRLGATAEAEEKEAEEKAEAGEEGAGGKEGEEAGGEAEAGEEEGESEEGAAEGEEAAAEEGEEAEAEAGGEASAGEGESIFTTNCATCHTLSEAGATGTVGPNLDELKPEKSVVETQVTNGGGGMPAFAGTLSPEEIEAVAEYVSGVAGTGGG